VAIMLLRGDEVPAATSYINVRLLRAKTLAMTTAEVSLRGDVVPVAISFTLL